MTHQNHSTSDNLSTLGTTKTKYQMRVNLLVKTKLKNLSLKTSDPKRAMEILDKYLGIQVHHQTQMGKMWFMKSMIEQNIFTHEVQVLALKTIHGHKWRRNKEINSKIKRQCKEFVASRMAVTNEELRLAWKTNRKTVHMLNKVMSELKIRMTRKTFDFKVMMLEREARENVIREQRQSLNKRLDGMKKKDVINNNTILEKELRGIKVNAKDLENVAVEQNLVKEPNFITLGNVELDEEEKEFLQVHYKCREKQRLRKVKIEAEIAKVGSNTDMRDCIKETS